MIFEVFRQERKGQAFVHAGSFHAPNREFERGARGSYARRQESVALWVVPRDEIMAIDEFPDEFDLKYRRVDGYSIKARLKEARARAGSTERADAEMAASPPSERTGTGAPERSRAEPPEVADDELILGWRNSGGDRDRAVSGGGRRLLVDRAERDRHARRCMSPRARPRHRCRPARLRPPPRGVPLRAASSSCAGSSGRGRSRATGSTRRPDAASTR